MANEDQTTYTKQDPGGFLSVAPNTTTLTLLPSAASSWVVDDKGVAHFAGANPFEHLIDFQLSGTGQCFIGVLANVVGTMTTIVGDEGWGIRYHGGSSDITIFEFPGNHSDGYSASVSGVHFWCKFAYNPSIGSFGQISLKIYSDSDRTALLDTLTITLHNQVRSFRYDYVVTSTGGGTADVSGTINGLDLQEPSISAPGITTIDGLTESQRVLGAPTEGEGLIINSNDRRVMGETTEGLGLIRGANKKLN